MKKKKRERKNVMNIYKKQNNEIIIKIKIKNFFFNNLLIK